MMTHSGLRRKTTLAAALALLAPAALAGQAAARPEPPTRTYWVYVGAESADLLHRIRFGPGGAVVEKTFEVGEQAAEMEGPHGLQVSPDGKFLFMTTGHGAPDGKFWKYAIPADTLVGPGIFLGNFPASIDVTPDGLYAISANFNAHGDMVPSSQSVVYTPDNVEVARIVTCVMPHGSRVSPDGRRQYSGCMMDDQLVEIDMVNFRVSRRFSLAKGKEGPISMAGDAPMATAHTHANGRSHQHDAPAAPTGSAPAAPVVDPAEVGYGADGHAGHVMAPQSCSPTWAQPSAEGDKVYVACNKADEILEVDVERWAVSRRFRTGRGPYNLAVTPDGTKLLATLKQGAAFEVFDLATGRSVAQIKNSTTVSHAVVASPDSRYAFVSSEGVGAQPGKVDIYDLKALAKVATVDVGQQAGGMAFWKMQ
ncbi:MAG: hypothetical protein NW201_14255 [Gemmatimonadales bacterium]|nr:hypothetical protein [Gemmatimonadales bacterium]